MDKLLWFNPDIQYMFRKNIVEYDMQSASLAVSERYHLIDPIRLEQLKNMPKDQRTREVGLMQRDDQVFSERMVQGVIDTRAEFLKQNNLDDTNIIALHSDAIIFNMTTDIIGAVDCVKFVPKHSWSSYLRYNGVEIYYGDGCIDYKGIPKELLKLHTLGINRHLLKIFDMVERCDDSVIRYLNKFEMRYLQDRLPDYFYQAFGRRGQYKLENLNLFAFLANVVMEDMYEW